LDNTAAKLYYEAYEERYKKVYQAGIERWGHSPNDADLRTVLTEWVDNNNLRGKKVIEFACGEGGAGLILAELGCIYTGVDISVSAIEKSEKLLKDYENARVYTLDMVRSKPDGVYDAAIDIMGLHMLILDVDREKYLRNMNECLHKNAPVLFFRESFRTDAYEGHVYSINDWYTITGDDYSRQEKRTVVQNGTIFEVKFELLPARAKSHAGYWIEMEFAGFKVQEIIELKSNTAISQSACIYVNKN